MHQPRFQSYMICTSPRSGSTLLCALLTQTGIAGRPDSHFHEPSLEQWLEDHDLGAGVFRSRDDALRAVFASAREYGTHGTGVFGLRMQRRSFPFFIEQVDRLYPRRSSDVDRIEAAFGPTLFAYLQRPNKLAQAVSLVVAEQSGLWHRNADGSERERLSPPRQASYDHEAIERHIGELAAMDAEWEQWFAQEGVVPLRLTYDHLASAPQEILACLLDALGLDPTRASSVQPPTAKLADARSREWIERFTTETRRREA